MLLERKREIALFGVVSNIREARRRIISQRRTARAHRQSNHGRSARWGVEQRDSERIVRVSSNGDKWNVQRIVRVSSHGDKWNVQRIVRVSSHGNKGNVQRIVRILVLTSDRDFSRAAKHWASVQ